jgi:hypothetical protein
MEDKKVQSALSVSGPDTEKSNFSRHMRLGSRKGYFFFWALLAGFAFSLVMLDIYIWNAGDLRWTDMTAKVSLASTKQGDASVRMTTLASTSSYTFSLRSADSICQASLVNTSATLEEELPVSLFDLKLRIDTIGESDPSGMQLTQVGIQIDVGTARMPHLRRFAASLLSPSLFYSLDDPSSAIQFRCSHASEVKLLGFRFSLPTYPTEFSLPVSSLVKCVTDNDEDKKKDGSKPINLVSLFLLF